LTTVIGFILAFIFLVLVVPPSVFATDLGRLVSLSSSNEDWTEAQPNLAKEVLLNLLANGVCCFVLAFVFTLQSEWLRQAHYGSSRHWWHRVGRFGGALFPVIPVLLFSLWPTLSGTALSITKGWQLAALLTIAGWILMLASAQSGNARLRYHEEWAGLQIDSDNFGTSRSAAN
jgi:hypothetical protein